MKKFMVILWLVLIMLLTSCKKECDYYGYQIYWTEGSTNEWNNACNQYNYNIVDNKIIYDKIVAKWQAKGKEIYLEDCQ